MCVTGLKQKFVRRAKLEQTQKDIYYRWIGYVSEWEQILLSKEIWMCLKEKYVIVYKKVSAVGKTRWTTEKKVFKETFYKRPGVNEKMQERIGDEDTSLKSMVWQ